jgi:ankyrin repeat protein
VSRLLIVSIVVFAVVAVTTAQSANEALFEAARAGDTARIEAALAQGAGLNATSRYNVTPLIFAASNGRLEAVKLLVARGANVNAQDSFYRATAGGMALGNGHIDIAVFLFQNGWNGADDLMFFGVQSDNITLVKTALTGTVTHKAAQAALSAAEPSRESR